MTSLPPDLVQELRELAAKRLSRPNLAEVPLEAPLTALGLDSLDKVELLFEVENLFDVEIPDETAAGMTSLADVATFLVNTLRKPGLSPA